MAEHGVGSALLKFNALALLALLLLIGITAFLCARKWRNTNDFKKSLRLYLILCPVLLGIALLLKLPILLGLLGLLGGFVVLSACSNYYFYH